MDEFNRNFDPTDEYMSLDDTENTSVADDEIIAQDTQEPVEVETVEDDVFEAFEKAENTPSPYDNPIPQPIPVQPPNSTKSFSNLVRKGVFSME